MKTKSLFKILASGAVLSLLFFSSAPALAADDVTPPSDVENVQAFPGDGEVILTWDAATDDTEVVSYKIYVGLESMTGTGGEYNLPTINAGNVLEYTVTDLENDTTYYFAVTAVDAAGNESEYYSYEVSATPTGGAASSDTEAPVVVSAEAVSNTEVKVVFSEAVVLLGENPETAFYIEDVDTLAELTVLAAVLDESDAEEKTVLLTTDPEEEEAVYMLTVGIEVTDQAGNPIVSGSSDTATFVGVAAVQGEGEAEAEGEGGAETADNESPLIESAEATESTEVEVVFSEEIVLPSETPEASFVITEADNETVILEVKSAVLKEDQKTVTLITGEQDPGTEYVLKVSGIIDLAGNSTADDYTSTASFTGKVVEIADLIAPEDVTNFLAEVSDSLVKLSWTASVNSAGDLIDQILYQSEDEGVSYGEGTSLGATAASYEVSGLEEGKTYTFKITVKDAAGNESEGVIATVTLPETGPALGVVVMISLLGGALFARRRMR